MAGRICVVDDDSSVLSLTKLYLSRAGFEVEGFVDAQEALKALEERSFDVLVVDLYMPGFDGFDMLQWIETHCPQMVALVLSGTTLVDDVIRAMEHGAFDFCAKPVENQMLVNKVRRALANKELRDRNVLLMKEIREKNIELENRLGQLELAHHLLQAQTQALQADLHQAQGIQQSLLPRKLAFWDKVSLSGLYYPAGKVGGDLFDVFQLDASHLGLYIADTAGHGVSSALVTVFLKLSVESLLHQENGAPAAPGLVLRELNARLFNEPLGHEFFVSMAYCVLNIDTLELEFASAGHPAVQHRHASGALEELRHSAPALGVNANVKYGTTSCNLQPSDVLVFHTDGATDVQDPSGAFFGISRLCRGIERGIPEVQEWIRGLDRQLKDFAQSRPFADDCTVLAFAMTPQAAPDILLLTPSPQNEQDRSLPGNAVANATEGGCLYIQMLGVGTWQESQQVADLVQQARKERLPLAVLDFAHCIHLDSTFMGVLHTLCTQAETSPELQIHLQNLPRNLLKLMSELGLTTVLMCFRPKARPLPASMRKAAGARMSRREMSRSLLSAHEALVKADPNNAQRFAQVLSVLQHEVQAEEDPSLSKDTR